MDRSWLHTSVLLMLAVLLSCAHLTASAAQPEADCKDILVLGTRGSGEKLDEYQGVGPSVEVFWESFRQRVPATTTVELWPNPYEAVKVFGGWDSIDTGFPAWVSNGKWYRYRRSVVDGIAKLTAKINETVALCGTRTRLMLSGFSQGAEVSADVYAALGPAARDRVLGMAIWGDTRFNSASQSAEGNFEPGRNGLFLETRDEFRDPAQVLSYCHKLDPICQGIFDFNRIKNPTRLFSKDQHSNYDKVGDAANPTPYPVQAARAFANRLRPAPVSAGPRAVITTVDGAVAGEQFGISGAESWDAEDRPLTYEWDLDNSGRFATVTPGPIVVARFDTPGGRTIGLRVSNDAGQTATTTAVVNVVAPDAFTGPPGKPVEVVSTSSADHSSATLTWQAATTGPPTEAYYVLASDGSLFGVIEHGGSASFTLPAEDLPISMTVQAINRVGNGASADPVVMSVPRPGTPHGDLNQLWNAYGDQGGHWTGGDRTTSVPLPDGRTAWLFSDTFLGTVHPNRSRPSNSPMVHNTLVVQHNDGSLGATLHGGTTTAPRPLVEVDGSPNQYWVADGIVENGTLKVLYNLYQATGGGSLDVRPHGTALATFSLPGLTLTDVRTLPLREDMAWGSDLLSDNGYTYIYGAEHAGDAAKGLRIARVPSGGLGGAWEFWTGTAWSAQEADSVRVLTGVGTAFSVTKVDNQYALVTIDSNTTFSSTVVGYSASAPTGPFGSPRALYEAPEAGRDGNPIIVYDATVHPQYSSGGRLMLSYNVNSLNPAHNYADVRIYRPRFITVQWPLPAPDPAAVPAAPTGLSGVDYDDGSVHLSWRPVDDIGVVYRMYQRDETAGQDYFTRISGAYAKPAAAVGFLRNNHIYEFRVTAENNAGESPPSEILRMRHTVDRPLPPTNLIAIADVSGAIRLNWTASPSPGLVHYRVLRRDITGGQADFAPINFPDSTKTTVTDSDLDHQHTYVYKVTANRSSLESDPSNEAQTTAFYVLPGAPTGLTATARPNGQIDLVWEPPPAANDKVWYLVYMRDVTAGEEDYTRLKFPITTCCRMTAEYLTNGHLYEFVVSATNRGGEGEQSRAASAVSTYPKPAAPTGLTAQAGDGRVTLRWTSGSAESVWYWVYLRNVSLGEGTFTRLAYPLTTCCELTVDYLFNYHTYEFVVSASSQGGESVHSSPARATPMAPLPARPTGLTATAQPDGTIKLDWQEATPNVWFNVYMRDATTGEAFAKLPLPVTTCCTWAGHLLTNDHRYEFKVAATNASGEGPPSDVASATSRYSPPPAPTNLRGRSSGDGTIDLDWDPPAPNLYYWVYFRDATAGETFRKSLYPTDKTHATWDSLRHGHVYEFKVSASNAGGEGPASSTISVTSYGGLPAPPGFLTATAGDGQVILRWSPSATPNVWYLVWMRNASVGQSWQQLQTPVTTCCTMTAGYLTNGDTYEFKVAATNVSGNSTPTNVASARPLPPFPVAPTNLSATPGDGQVVLNWTASSTPNVWYLIEYRAVGGSWTRLQWPLTTCCQFTFAPLTNGTTYEFRVRATNVAGDSAPSIEARARPMPPFPSAPTNLTASPGDGTVTINWMASSTPRVWYLIEYRPAGGTWTRLQWPLTTCCQFTMTWLANGTTYEFRVRATNAAGDSAPSNVAAARPMPPLPAAPTALYARMVGDSTVQLDWPASSTPNVYYWIYFRSGNGTYSRIHHPAITNKATLWMEWGRVYEFYVRAVNITGESGDSPHVFVRVGPPDRTSACAKAAGSYTLGAGQIPGQIFPHPSATLCGYRDGHRINYTMAWSTNGNRLLQGTFYYQLWDCDTGRMVVDRYWSYPTGTTQTSHSGTDWVYIDWTHRYKVRAAGGGDVRAGAGQAMFNNAAGAPVKFDNWSGCF
jgi:fibronectin type 3 domain-containing protein